MILIRCYQCRTFFEKDRTACPGCEAPRRPVNVALESQAWRSNLNWHAEHADRHT